MPQSDYWPFGKGKSSDNNEFVADASILQKQLGDMEGEVKEIKMELAAIKQIRFDSKPHIAENAISPLEEMHPEAIKTETQIVTYGDKFNTLSEISRLQDELNKARNKANEERFQKEKYELKLRDLEEKINNICSNELVPKIKESRKKFDEEAASLKTQIRNLKEETEELKIVVAEKTDQLQEYRVKYLQAQQQVEELKRQLDVIEFDNKQVSDQIQIEIQKIKMQFQEKLQELAPLPDLLKGAQMQLQEAKQLQRLAEDNSHQLSNELYRVKEKLVIAVSNLNQEKIEKNNLTEENKSLKVGLDEKNKENEELLRNLEDNKCKVMRLEEKILHQEALFKEKALECSQLLKDLAELKEEGTRSLGRCKERADSMRRYLHTQISELERQLIQSRAQCRSCQKERDEIRQRMQMQINNLQENFELGEIRLRALQGQVSSLKNSYTTILAVGEEGTEIDKRVTI